MRKWQIIADKVQKLIVANQFILYLAVFMVAFFVFLIIQSNPTFLDPDSFYHLKMTKLIAEQGPVINFPWLQFTVLKEYYIDHHFLYHVAGIPFVKLMGDFTGYKFYTILLNTLLIFGLYLFLKKEKIRWAEFFILILLSSQGFIYRISLAKASAFSLIILFLGIYCLFKRKNIWLFLVSWLYVLSYGGFLLIWAITCFYILADSLYQAFIVQRPERLKLFKRFWLGIKNIFSAQNLKIGLASFSGVIIGVVFNPYFPKNLNFIWEQLVQIGLINYIGKVNVGGEWYPYKLPDLLQNVGITFIVFVFALFIFFITIKKQKASSIFFFLTTLFFLGFTLKSKRYVEYLMPFMAFFVAYAYTFSLANIHVWQKFNHYRKMNKIIAALLYTLILLVVIFFPMVMVKDISSVYRSFRRGIAFNEFAGISQYLINNSQQGEIIMQTDWDDFPMLFYQNSKNYYIVGLDPTFMYNYDPKLYQLFADITMAKVSTELSQKVKANFNASYFIVDKDRDQLNKYLQADSGFVKVYEDSDAWLYQVK
jgi:hypothetical protein